MSHLHIVGVTQEPYGTYHFVPLLKNERVSFVHLVPDLRELPKIATTGITISDDQSILDYANLLIIEGGSLNDWTNAVACLAKKRGIPVVFIELAYPPKTLPTMEKTAVKPDMVIATNRSSIQYYSDLFHKDEDEIRLCLPPMLEDFTTTTIRTETPTLLLVSTVSAEIPDKGKDLRDFANSLTEKHIDFEIRLHPREPVENWDNYKLATGTVGEQLAGKWAVIGYQGTFFAYSNYARIPTYHLSGEEWMEELLPEDWAYSKPIHTPDNLVTLIGLGELDWDEYLLDSIKRRFAKITVYDEIFAYWHLLQQNRIG